MIKLIEPDARYLESYINAFEEYKEHDISDYSFSDAKTVNIFEKFENYRNEKNLKPGRVGSHYFWLVDDEKNQFLGEISIRHNLNETLKRYGGHIGYGIRYSEWNKKFGTLMLKLALIEAKRIGLSKILIICDDDNTGSARVIEKNGFVLSDKIENIIDGKTVITRRYWKEI